MNEQPEWHISKYNGSKIWYLPSRGPACIHRLDGPAIEFADGSKQWWVNGKLYRLDGPAVEWASGSKEWWVDGKLHRLDGPAYDAANGTKQWWVNHKRHRLCGPAVENADGTKQWWVDNKRLETEEMESWLSENKIDLSTTEGQIAFKIKWM